MAKMIITQTTNDGRSAAAGTDRTILGKDDFFRMLMAQLQNQDPLSPMDGSQFAVQLAQFSSLEQLQNLNTQMTAISQSQIISKSAFALGLIGRDVEVVSGEETEIATVTGFRIQEDSIALSLGNREVDLKDVISIR